MLHFLFARFSVSPKRKRTPHLGFLLRNASHIFNSFTSVVQSSESALSKQKQELHESSKRVNLKGIDKSHSVFDIFRSYGLSDTQISKAIRTYPPLLRMKLKILLPKLRFLDSFVLSRSELQEILTSSSVILRGNLEKNLIPRMEILKTVLDNDHEKLLLALGRGTWIFYRQGVGNVVPNMKVLRELGVPNSSVTQLLINHFGVAFIKPAKLAEHVKFAIKIGIEPDRPTFVRAIYVLSSMKKSTWKSKLDAFERLGWSKEMTISVFRKYPTCMLISEDKIANSIKFFVGEMGLTSEDIATCPSLLGSSLNQRIVPRWSVVKTLKMNGLLKKNPAPRTIFAESEKEFLEKFVNRFQGSCPQLLNIYKGSKASLAEVP